MTHVGLQKRKEHIIFKYTYLAQDESAKACIADQGITLKSFNDDVVNIQKTSAGDGTSQLPFLIM